MTLLQLLILLGRKDATISHLEAQVCAAKAQASADSAAADSAAAAAAVHQNASALAKQQLQLQSNDLAAAHEEVVRLTSIVANMQLQLDALPAAAAAAADKHHCEQILLLQRQLHDVGVMANAHESRLSSTLTLLQQAQSALAAEQRVSRDAFLKLSHMTHLAEQHQQQSKAAAVAVELADDRVADLENKLALIESRVAASKSTTASASDHSSALAEAQVQAAPSGKLSICSPFGGGADDIDSVHASDATNASSLAVMIGSRTAPFPCSPTQSSSVSLLSSLQPAPNMLHHQHLLVPSSSSISSSSSAAAVAALDGSLPSASRHLFSPFKYFPVLARHMTWLTVPAGTHSLFRASTNQASSRSRCSSTPPLLNCLSPIE